ncbi:MAG: hypothetical protein WAK03_04960 [Methylocystis sp.]|jgi:hypothetical protein
MSFPARRAIDDPAEAASGLLTRIGIFLLFMVSLLAPILAGQTIYILLPIGAILLLMGATIAPDSREKTRSLRAMLAKPPVLGALFLVAFTALSLTWTPFAAQSTERFLKDAATLALVAIAAGFLPPRTRTCNLNLLPIGVAAAAISLAAAGAVALLAQRQLTVEEMIDGNALARSGVGLALLMWPAAGALAVRGRWYFAGGLTIVSAAAVLLSGAPNVLPALLVGAAVFALSFGRARRVARRMGGVAAATIALAPIFALLVHFALGARTPDFARPLETWGQMVANDGARTLIGHGFGSALYGLFGGYLDPRTPRSLVFQIWFDLGVLGAAAFAATAAKAFSRIGLLRPALAPFLLAGLGAGLVICLLGPAAEQLWAFTLAGLDAIAYVLVIRGQFRKKRPQLPSSWRAAVEEE